ncbi:MAG: (2E,6E)-farnesyl diphosphate synthase [Gammaproteobacteria bacterium]|nr:(2E,6E)-farnesyl diphosphate synthase [Gammaproteobacteria bacterium]
MKSEFKDWLTACQSRIEQKLDHWLPAAGIHPTGLHEAMRYAVLGGGKRIRPLLVYAAGGALGVAEEALDGPACAVEFIHVYSLVHDDLPAMDDDDLRRGKPTCHKAFDEPTAILAGDALQTLAFYVLAHDPAIQTDAGSRLKMIETLALATGSRGMAGGQAIDLAAVGRALTLAELEDMHIHKTGALIRASVTLGALSLPGVDHTLLERLDRYAKCIGLAFQIRDDIIDIESDTATLGKTQGADAARNKPTYPALLGMAEAKQRALDLHQEALQCLDALDERADPLRWIAGYIVERIS